MPMEDAFQKLCESLDQQTELYTVTELHDKMRSLSATDEVYSIKRMKKKLEEHYKDFIIFGNEPGRSNVVCFKDMASAILSDKW